MNSSLDGILGNLNCLPFTAPNFGVNLDSPWCPNRKDPPWTFANVKKVEPNVNCQVDIALKPEAEGGGKSRKHQNAGHDCVQRLEKEQLLQVLHFVGVHWRAQDRQKMPFLDGRKALKTGSWIGND